MKVILESPYAGDVERNIAYAHKCIKDCFNRGEYPFASHILYTTALNDLNEKERKLGIDAGLQWGKCAEKTVVYIDFGISKGMQYGIENAINNGRIVEYRKLNSHLTMSELYNFGFKIEFSNSDDEFIRQTRKKGVTYVTTTWKKSGVFVSQLFY